MKSKIAEMTCPIMLNGIEIARQILIGIVYFGWQHTEICLKQQSRMVYGIASEAWLTVQYL